MLQFLIAEALLAAHPAAPASAQCAAKPFTLKKPAQAQPVAPAAAPPKKPAQVAAKTNAPKPKPKVLSDCKEPAKKG